MLPAENRLRRRRECATAVRRGRRAGRPLVVAHLYLSAEGDSSGADASPGRPGGGEPAPGGRPGAGSPPRVGVAVGRAVGNAVVRNTVKRRLRHLLRDRVGMLPPGALLVVRALPGAADAPFADLAADLDRALARVLTWEGAA